MTVGFRTSAGGYVAYATTFTFTCPWGCTVDVTDGQEQPHVCDDEDAIVAIDALLDHRLRLVR